jgi:ClpP class serine protease
MKMERVYSMGSDQDFEQFKKYAKSVSGAEALALTEKAKKDFKVQIFAGSGQIEFSPLDEQQRIESETNNIKGVGILSYSGVMESESRWWGVGTKEIDQILNDLGRHPSTTAVLFEINTVGGSLGHLEVLAETISTFETTYKKRLDILVSEIAASAGVWVVSGAKRIWVSDAVTEMGSIGIQSVIYDYSGAMKADGVRIRRLKAAQSVNKNIETDNAMKGDFSMIEDSMTYKANVFIDRVKKGRGTKMNLRVTEAKNNPDNIPDVLTGLMYIGQQAVDIGLADGIKSKKQILSEMLAEANAEEITVYGESEIVEIIDNEVNAKAQEEMSANDILEKVKSLLITPETTAAVVTPNAVDQTALIEQVAKATAAQFAPQLQAAQEAARLATEAVTAAKLLADTQTAEIERLRTAAQTAASVGTANPTTGTANVNIEESAQAIFAQTGAGILDLSVLKK